MLLALCLLAGGTDTYTALSQSPANAAPPASAEAFAAIIDHHYNALHSLATNFLQQYDGMGMHRTERGTLLLRRAGKLSPGAGQMRWTYAEPAGKLFILDGKDAYFYTPGQVEIPRVPAKKLDDLRSPLAFLLGHAELARQLTGLTLTGSGSGAWTLTGVPHGMEKRIASLAITARQDGTITAMRVEDTDGALNSFALSGEQANAAVPLGAFTFTPPAGTHLVDGLPPL